MTNNGFARYLYPVVLYQDDADIRFLLYIPTQAIPHPRVGPIGALWPAMMKLTACGRTAWPSEFQCRIIGDSNISPIFGRERSPNKFRLLGLSSQDQARITLPRRP